MPEPSVDILVVSREHVEPVEVLRTRFASGRGPVTVVMDRRMGERRSAPEVFPVERRLRDRRGIPPPTWQEQGYFFGHRSGDGSERAAQSPSAAPGAPAPGRLREPARVTRTHGQEARLWAVVLAAGEGVRLKPLTRRIHQDERPKQYAVLLGSRSLLRQTLDRLAPRIPLARTVVVTMKWHASYLARELEASRAPWLLAQPADRGTAAGVLFPVHWIHARDPEALVAVFPSDHFVLEDAEFMDHVEAAAVAIRRHPERIVLLGIPPTAPEPEYGWIELGDPLDSIEPDLFRVRRFVEKPSPEVARSLVVSGHLWNTLVMVGRASAFVDLGRRFLPVLHNRLARLAAFRDTGDEAWALQQMYALAPTANFSRAILEACPASLAVYRLPALTWCDLGCPNRVVRLARLLGLSPAWLPEIERVG